MNACLTTELIDNITNHAPVHRIKIKVLLFKLMNCFCEPDKPFLNGLQIHAGSCVKYLSVLVNHKVDSNLLDFIFELETKSFWELACIDKLTLVHWAHVLVMQGKLIRDYGLQMIDDFVLVLDKLKYLRHILIWLEVFTKNHATLDLLQKLFKVSFRSQGLYVLKSLW